MSASSSAAPSESPVATVALPSWPDVIAFDADDTLWRSQDHFDEVEEQVAGIIARHRAVDGFRDRLYEVERRNLPVLGYGAKSFTLSLVEAAVELTEHRITPGEIAEIVALGKQLLQRPVELMPDVDSVVPRVAAEHDVVLITKGDLIHQEAKIAGSGLAEHFSRIEIVSEKDEATYRRVLHELDVEPDRFVMIGNSLRSDCVPVLAVGGRAVHVPAPSIWVHEDVAPPADVDGRLVQIDRLGQLPQALHELR